MATKWRVKAGRDIPKPFTIAAGAAGKFAVRAADAAPDGDKKKLPTFSMVGYTGDVMTPGGWSLPIIVDLDGVIVPSGSRPILRQHDPLRIVGHSTKVTVDEDGISLVGVMSGVGPDSDEVCRLSANGFPWQASIGANPVRTEFLEAGETTEVNGREVAGPMTISRETELGEVSFVPLGADGNTSATVTASKKKVRAMTHTKKKIKLARKRGVEAAQKFSDDDIDGMDEAEAKAALKECQADDDSDETDKKDVDSDDDSDVDADDDSDVDADDEPDVDADDEPKKADAGKRKSVIHAARGSHARILAGRKAEGQEARRVADIKAKCRALNAGTVRVGGQSVDLAAHAIESGWSVDKTELHALRAGRPGAGVGNSPHIHVGSQPVVTEAVLEAAILHASRHSLKLEDDSFYSDATPDGRGSVRRVPVHLQKQAQGDFNSRYTDQVQQAAHTLFKGRCGLHEVLAACYRASGSTSHHDFKSEHGIRAAFAEWGYREGPGIRAEGASNASISNILANVMNKFALQGYLYTEQAWRDVCAIRPVNDFKPAKSINLLGDVIYKQVGPTGELDNASIGDQAFANQAQPFGRIMTIPWTNIVNDDLGILSTLPQKIGQGAGLALNDLIWTTWKNMANGSINGDDGNPFWRTTSALSAANVKAGVAYKPNKHSGAPISAAVLKAVKALFDNQIDPNGNPLGFDGQKPVILHGPSLWQDVTALMQAASLVYGGASTALQPNMNVWQGMMKPVMSRYIEAPNYLNSATAFWVLFDPVALATIEVAFLNGTDTPAVLQAGPDYQFDRLGISIRGTMPFGVTQQNFRGGVYAVGA